MKKKSKRPVQTGRLQKVTSSGTRGRPRKSLGPADGSSCDPAGPETTNSDFSTMTADDCQKPPESRSRSAGRSSAALCRLCHGRFSPRSLRHAFHRCPQDSVVDGSTAARSPLRFHTDFQRLVGVQLDRDPRLSEFVCKKCHAKFYKCHSILVRFLQRVNLPPRGKENRNGRKKAARPESPVNRSLSTAASPSFTSDHRCLLSLVSWAHHHGGACSSCPDLKEVLEGRRAAVWGCVDGHRYVMDARGATPSPGNAREDEEERGQEDGDEEEELGQENGDEEDEQPLAGRINTLEQHSPPADTGQTWTPAVDDWTGSSEGQEEAMSPVLDRLDGGTADSDPSDRAISEEELEERGKGTISEEELFEPYSDKRTRRENVPNKRRQSPKSFEEPKVRKKPGPKPGWKNKFKPKGEELPNIYKCPYPGCTAVYRAPDGLKKHIKEHHEEVRERPCPHPGCNKVFMIDRYLQRHVKLIHTEERNYICDQCGQTFKQRKHLSVHQMRHSGAKPLQCEVCGFQCRQRASLKYHMTKHKAEADLEFECLMCRKRFEKAHNLNVHMSMVHPLTQPEAPRGGGPQPQPPYADLHTITLTGELVQHYQDPGPVQTCTPSR